MEVKAGDILAIKGTKFISELICKLTHGEVSHVGLVVGESPALVMEALKRVVTRPIEESIADASAALLIHPRFLDRDARERLVREACRWSASSYSYTKLLLAGLDALFRTSFFSSNLSSEHHPICSYHVAKAYAAIGFHFGEPARSISPQEILDFARRHSELFTITPLL